MYVMIDKNFHYKYVLIFSAKRNYIMGELLQTLVLRGIFVILWVTTADTLQDSTDMKKIHI